MDTIFALSSGLVPSGVAVLRLSGPQVNDIVTCLVGKKLKPRFMHYGPICLKSGEILDHGLTVLFPAPHSFTGQDCAEFHIHGGKATVARLLQELASFDNCRQAEPGEFSRRAFSEGKIDLTGAEGLADLIEAETESQRRMAIMGASGALATLYRKWRDQLIRARALIEAELDFSDESDVPGSVSDTIWRDMAALKHQITDFVADGRRAAAMRDGLKIVIAGAPNAGKSSVMNLLAGRDVAIVTEEAGTTRDALEVRLTIGTLPVLVTDTAGLRQTDNRIEKIGIDIAYARILEADLVLMLDDMSDPHPIELPETRAIIWHVGNKSDQKTGSLSRWPYQFSARTGEGWDYFMEALSSLCQEHIATLGHLVPARQRQLDLLSNSCDDLRRAVESTSLDLELRAEYLRLASNALGRITGDINVEDLLDVIFSEFCIGK